MAPGDPQELAKYYKEYADKLNSAWEAMATHGADFSAIPTSRCARGRGLQDAQIRAKERPLEQLNAL